MASRTRTPVVDSPEDDIASSHSSTQSPSTVGYSANGKTPSSVNSSHKPTPVAPVGGTDVEDISAETDEWFSGGRCPDDVSSAMVNTGSYSSFDSPYYSYYYNRGFRDPSQVPSRMGVRSHNPYAPAAPAAPAAPPQSPSDASVHNRTVSPSRKVEVLEVSSRRAPPVSSVIVTTQRVPNRRRGKKNVEKVDVQKFPVLLQQSVPESPHVNSAADVVRIGKMKTKPKLTEEREISTIVTKVETEAPSVAPAEEIPPVPPPTITPPQNTQLSRVTAKPRNEKKPTAVEDMNNSHVRGYVVPKSDRENRMKKHTVAVSSNLFSVLAPRQNCGTGKIAKDTQHPQMTSSVEKDVENTFTISPHRAKKSEKVKKEDDDTFLERVINENATKALSRSESIQCVVKQLHEKHSKCQHPGTIEIDSIASIPFSNCPRLRILPKNFFLGNRFDDAPLFQDPGSFLIIEAWMLSNRLRRQMQCLSPSAFKPKEDLFPACSLSSLTNVRDRLLSDIEKKVFGGCSSSEGSVDRNVLSRMMSIETYFRTDLRETAFSLLSPLRKVLNEFILSENYTHPRPPEGDSHSEISRLDDKQLQKELARSKYEDELFFLVRYYWSVYAKSQKITMFFPPSSPVICTIFFLELSQLHLENERGNEYCRRAFYYNEESSTTNVKKTQPELVQYLKLCCNYLMGRSHERVVDGGEARQCLTTALRVALKYKESAACARIAYILGLAMDLLGRNRDAYRWFLVAMRLGIGSLDVSVLSDVSFQLSSHLATIGRNDLAEKAYYSSSHFQRSYHFGLLPEEKELIDDCASLHFLSKKLIDSLLNSGRFEGGCFPPTILAVFNTAASFFLRDCCNFKGAWAPKHYFAHIRKNGALPDGVLEIYRTMPSFTRPVTNLALTLLQNGDISRAVFLYLEDLFLTSVAFSTESMIASWISQIDEGNAIKDITTLNGDNGSQIWSNIAECIKSFGLLEPALHIHEYELCLLRTSEVPTRRDQDVFGVIASTIRRMCEEATRFRVLTNADGDYLPFVTTKMVQLSNCHVHLESKLSSKTIFSLAERGLNFLMKSRSSSLSLGEYITAARSTQDVCDYECRVGVVLALLQHRDAVSSFNAVEGDLISFPSTLFSRVRAGLCDEGELKIAQRLEGDLCRLLFNLFEASLDLERVGNQQAFPVRVSVCETEWRIFDCMEKVQIMLGDFVGALRSCERRHVPNTVGTATILRRRTNLPVHPSRELSRPSTSKKAQSDNISSTQYSHIHSFLSQAQFDSMKAMKFFLCKEPPCGPPNMTLMTAKHYMDLKTVDEKFLQQFIEGGNRNIDTGVANVEQLDEGSLQDLALDLTPCPFDVIVVYSAFWSEEDLVGCFVIRRTSVDGKVKMTIDHSWLCLSSQTLSAILNPNSPYVRLCETGSSVFDTPLFPQGNYHAAKLFSQISTFDDQLRHFYDDLIRPIEGMLNFTDVQTVCFVSDGIIGNLPFHAFYRQSGDSLGSFFMIEKAITTVFPSLLHMCNTVHRQRQLSVTQFLEHQSTTGPVKHQFVSAYTDEDAILPERFVRHGDNGLTPCCREYRSDENIVALHQLDCPDGECVLPSPYYHDSALHAGNSAFVADSESHWSKCGNVIASNVRLPHASRKEALDLYNKENTVESSDGEIGSVATVASQQLSDLDGELRDTQRGNLLFKLIHGISNSSYRVGALFLHIPCSIDLKEEYCGNLCLSSTRFLANSSQIAAVWDLNRYPLCILPAFGRYAIRAIHETSAPVYRSILVAGAPRLLMPMWAPQKQCHRRDLLSDVMNAVETPATFPTINPKDRLQSIFSRNINVGAAEGLRKGMLRIIENEANFSVPDWAYWSYEGLP